MYTFKEWLEIFAASMTIIVSLVALYGLTAAIRKKLFKRLHNVLEHLEEIIDESRDKLSKK